MHRYARETDALSLASLSSAELASSDVGLGTDNPACLFCSVPLRPRWLQRSPRARTAKPRGRIYGAQVRNGAPVIHTDEIRPTPRPSRMVRRCRCCLTTNHSPPQILEPEHVYLWRVQGCTTSHQPREPPPTPSPMPTTTPTLTLPTHTPTPEPPPTLPRHMRTDGLHPLSSLMIAIAKRTARASPPRGYTRISPSHHIGGEWTTLIDDQDTH